MALLFMDSFDHVGTNVNLATSTKWGAGGGNARAGTAAARTGTHGFEVTAASGGFQTKTFTISGGAIMGAAFRTSSFGAPAIMAINESAINHMVIYTTAGGLLQVKRGTTTLATGTTVLAINSWYYIEFKAVIDDVNGSYELRIDGVTEAALTNAGPVDTRNAGTGVWNNVQLGGNSGYHFDDFYLCDTSGSAPQNNFLGAVKVELLMPQTDAVAVGSNTGLTPSTGTDHGALVDETTPNTTDYNSAATVGLKDTYQYPAMALTGTVYGVQTNLYVAKSDAGARSVCAVVRSNSVDYDGANVSPLTTFSYFTEIRQVNPNTSAAWTTSEIATIQAGMKVTV